MVCYWIEKFVRSISEARATVVKIILVVAMTGALSSSYLVTFYPNIFNLAGNKPWKDEVQFYKQEFELKRDVALIDQLTSKDQKVALISSFETKLLMDAQRKPFFYYFPLIESTHMRLAHFRGTYLHTQGRLRKTLDQLTEQKPEYVFIEQKLFKRLLPAQYYQAHEALEALLKYLDTNYQPVQEGQYLVALKHR